ncbi:MAG TPA: hypothetical protein VM677_12700 [Actinokineospora sp.]|jgi:hypothetical protein|nr:hypothetical protein [Actinokineospora sp.]
MTDGPVLHTEPGSTWWPVLWGPVFAITGAVLELVTGPVHWIAWAAVAVGLAGLTAGWVSARKRECSVELTAHRLRAGTETLAVERIVRVADEIPDAGARALGGGWTVPRKTDEVPLELDDGTTVLAWARDAAGLRAALSSLVESTPPV